MKLFIDTANISDIQKSSELGVIDGVTTNPSLMAKEGKREEEVLKEISQIVDGPISGEVKATTTLAIDMIEEGRAIARLHKNMVVKIPMCEEGLKATKQLSKEGIAVNMTLIFSANQALLAAKAGAAYVSPFIGRLDDISTNGMELIQTISKIFKIQNMHSEIIAASIRNPLQVVDCALAGAHIATIPYSVLSQMIQHPLTLAGIEKFIKDSTPIKGEQ